MADLKPLPTRDGFGEEMVVLGREDKNIVVVSADLEDATRAEYFKEFPERFFRGYCRAGHGGDGGGLKRRRIYRGHQLVCRISHQPRL